MGSSPNQKKFGYFFGAFSWTMFFLGGMAEHIPKVLGVLLRSLGGTFEVDLDIMEERGVEPILIIVGNFGVFKSSFKVDFSLF